MAQRHSYRLLAARAARALTLGVLLVTAAACGRQRDAEQTVGDFVDRHLVATGKVVSCSQLDSTRVIGDSTLNAMRETAARSSRFKRAIRYAERPSDGMLFYLRATIVVGTDTLAPTFYLNRQADGVVAFKEN